MVGPIRTCVVIPAQEQGSGQESLVTATCKGSMTLMTVLDDPSGTT